MKCVIRSNAACNAQHFTLTAIAHHFFEIVLHIEIWRSADDATESHHRNTIYGIIIQYAVQSIVHSVFGRYMRDNK